MQQLVTDLLLDTAKTERGKVGSSGRGTENTVVHIPGVKEGLLTLKVLRTRALIRSFPVNPFGKPCVFVMCPTALQRTRTINCTQGCVT